MKYPKITEDNCYDDQSLLRVIIHYARQSGLPLHYLEACYEIWYPHFKYREHAEEGFETCLSTALAEDNVTPLSQIIGIILSDLNNFKKHRNFE